MEFVHLHAHSDYSLLDGLARFSNEKGEPTEMLKELKAKGLSHQALTDHGNMFGAIEFYRACTATGIAPIMGCELYVASGSRFDRKGSASDDSAGGNFQKKNINHLTALARNNEGYQNLIELVSLASLEGFYYKPRVDKDLLREKSKGITALSGCLKGEVCQAILAGREDDAIEIAKTYEEIFGKGNFFLEIMDHGMEIQKQTNKTLLEISKKTGIPLVASNDCHYFKKDDAKAHDALICVGSGKKVDDEKRIRYPTEEFYYKSPEEMTKLFSWAPEAVKNTVHIAKQCAVSMTFNAFHLPDYQVPKGYTQKSYLKELCIKGLKARFPSGIPAGYNERLETELATINKMGFAGYFLIVWDFIEFARRSSIPVGPGRGSGAGSIVSYLLNITGIDPIKRGLLFERFLNPDRRTMPDLDIDFSDDGRDAVKTYVSEKYGFSNVAQIITFGTIQSRMAVRDVGRVLDIPIPEVDRIAKAIPQGMSIKDAKETSEFQAVIRGNPAAQKILAIASRIEGARRHPSVHAAGVVITKEAVTKYSPLYKNQTREVVTTGFNDKSLIHLGLLKVDFLGLRTLTVINNAVNLVRKNMGVKIDIHNLPQDDPKTFDLLGKGLTAGVFQVEGRGMQDLLIKMKPRKFEEIIAIIALFRPGPMKWLDEYVSRKWDPSRVSFDHPKLEPVLKETYGICIYQEQVMEISKQIAGFTPGEADNLRKAMSKKIPKELEKMKGKFIDGSTKNNIPPTFAKKLYEDLEDFGHYGFNKSHATAYAVIAYQTAYLKANYPLEFMVALLTSEIGKSVIGSAEKENKLATYIAAAKNMGIDVLAPSINGSQIKFSSKDGKIYFALSAIKNVGTAIAEEIVKQRDAKGPFKNLKDFFERTSKSCANRKALESFIKSGTIDDLLEGDSPADKRLEAFANIDFYLEEWKRDTSGMLFDFEPTPPPRREPISTNKDEALRWERDMLGLYLSEHPLTKWKSLIKSLPIKDVAELKALRATDDRIMTAGVIFSIHKQRSKRTGEPWARLTIEDLTGSTAAILFPKAFAKLKPELLTQGEVLIFSGRLSASTYSRGNEDNKESVQSDFLIDEAFGLNDLLAFRVKSIDILSSPSLKPRLAELKRLLKSSPGGNTVVRIANGTDYMVEFPKRVSISLAAWEEINKILKGNKFKIRL
ncbi:DNA polymerase III subunit alpha [Elusimicrobiota bacterium]